MKLSILKKFSFLLLSVALANVVVASAEDGVVDKAGRGLKKGGEAAERGIEKGAKATGKGLEKGAEATGKGVKKAGNWVSNKLDKVFK